MNHKTDSANSFRGNQGREFTVSFIVGFLLLTIAMLGLIYAMQHSRVQVWSKAMDSFHMPWLIASVQTFSSALSEFSGRAPEPVTYTARLLALASLLLVFVLGPTLFMFGLRERTVEQPVFRTLNLKLIVGGAITFSAIGVIVPTAIFQHDSFERLKEAQARQSNRDQMMIEMNKIVWSVVQYRVLPKSMRGGEGSMTGYSIPPKLAESRDGKYKATVEETSVRIQGISSVFSDARIELQISKNGQAVHWEYFGNFLR